MPEAESGMNMARIAALRAGLPDTVPGVTINRFCSSGLQSIAMAADRIRAGGAHIIIAGGSESMSMIPMRWQQVRAQSLVRRPSSRDLHEHGPHRRTGAAAATASRAKMPTPSPFAAIRTRCKAQAEGKFDDEIVPVHVETLVPNGNGKPHAEIVFDKDEGPRADTSLEALAKLKPVFHADGTVTAGNSSQTSDGAAAALVMSDTKAAELGLKPMARFVSFATAACRPKSWASVRWSRFRKRSRWRA